MHRKAITLMLKKTSKLLLITFLTLVLMSVNAPSVSACSCATRGAPLIDAVTDAAAIFSGKVTQVAFDEEPSSLFGLDIRVLRASVDVGQVWKGPSDQPLAVSTEVGSGLCGFEFQADTEYLIYAQEYDGQLYASLCSNTQPLAMAGEEINTLNSLFSPLLRQRFQPSATVTATGQGRYDVTADQLEAHLLFREDRPNEQATEEVKQQLRDLLTAQGAAKLLSSGLFGVDKSGFYFVVAQKELPNGDFNAFLPILSDVEVALQKENELGINRVEVRFSLQDCTQAAADARYSALADARTRAELLAAVAGGQRGTLVSLVETPNDASADSAVGLCYPVQQEWHPIPLPSDLDTLLPTEWRATVTATFKVEDAGTVQASATPTASLTAPSPTQLSPIATPTGQ